MSSPSAVRSVTEHARRSTLTVVSDRWQPGSGIASLDVWIYFNLISNTILLPILVATFIFSRHAKRRRPAPLINMCIAWILSGIFSLLLFYNGTARPDDQLPSLPLCTTQLSLLFGILPMWSVAVLALTYYVHFQVERERDTPRRKMIPMPLLIVAPYITQIAFSIAGIICTITSRPPVQIQRSFFFCKLYGHPLSNAMYIFVFVVCLGIILMKIQLALVFYRKWQALRNARSTNISLPQAQGNLPVLRMLIFGAYVFAGMICNVIQLFNPRNVIPYMYVAIAGTMVILVFGTQSDILEAWSFWKWRWSSLLPRRGGPSSTSPPTPNPLLDVNNHIDASSNWRDRSLFSPLPREEKSHVESEAGVNILQGMRPNEPPTPLPRAQLFRHIYANQEGVGPRNREYGRTQGGAAPSTTYYWF